MSDKPDQTIELGHYLRMIWRRKGIVILCSVTVVSTAFVALRFVPEVYESAATMMVVDPQPMTRELEQLMGGRVVARGYGVDEQRIAQFAGRIRSRPFLERVIRNLGMNRDPQILAEAAERQNETPGVDTDELVMRILVQNLQSRIQISGRGRGIYQVSVFDLTPENAQILAQWISELFVDISVQNSLDQLRATHDFGVEQLRIYEDKLRESEERWDARKRELIEHDLEGGLVSTENLVFAETLRRRISDEADAARLAIASAARTGLSADSDPQIRRILDDPSIAELTASLYTALQEGVTARLAAGVSDTDVLPFNSTNIRRRDTLREVERKIDQLEPGMSQVLRDERTRVVFSHISHEAQARAARFLGERISNFKARASLSPEDETQLARLEAEVMKNRRLLQSFEAQLVASEVNQAVETTDLGIQIEILDPAQLPLAPSRPNKRKILLMAVLMGPLLGLALAFAGETMDRTLRSLDDFKRIAPEPILGTTPLLSRRAIQKPGRIRRHWVPISVTTVLLLAAGVFAAREPLAKLMTNSEPIQIVTPEAPR